jgi:hypothetical protein
MILTQRQLDVLNHVVVDGQAWADNAKKEEHVLAKIAKYEAEYDASVAQGNYSNRSQREADEVQAQIDREANAPYSVKRANAYPPIGDQLDALWKGGQSQADMKLIIDGVKATYPKV